MQEREKIAERKFLKQEKLGKEQWPQANLLVRCRLLITTMMMMIIITFKIAMTMTITLLIKGYESYPYDHIPPGDFASVLHPSKMVICS